MVAEMLELLVRSFDEGRIQFATLEFDGRAIEIGTTATISRTRRSTRGEGQRRWIERQVPPLSAPETAQRPNSGGARWVATTAELRA